MLQIIYKEVSRKKRETILHEMLPELFRALLPLPLKDRVNVNMTSSCDVISNLF